MTDIKLYVRSSRFNKTLEVNNILEYRVEVNLENDSDGFDFVVSNVNGRLNGVFNRFDLVKITLNGHNLMKGIVDTVIYKVSKSGSTVNISGRDLMSILVDNDVTPDTYENINTVSYISNRCKAYGIDYKPFISTSNRTGMTIGTGESEISIINNLLLTEDQRAWYIYDTLYSGTWNTGASASCSFVRGVNNDGIKIEELELTEDSKNTKSEIIIYGTINDGEDDVIGTAINTLLTSRGVHRRMTKRSSRNDTASKYSASALKEVRDSMRDGVNLQLKAYTSKHFILPNNVCHVIDFETGIDDDFYIYNVTYTRSLTDGNIMTVAMIPNDKTFDIIWRKAGDSLTKSKFIDNRRK